MTVGVVAVITAFEPGDQLIDVVRRVILQTDSVIIVDDGSPSLLSGDDDRVRILLDEIGALAGDGDRVAREPGNRACPQRRRARRAGSGCRRRAHARPGHHH